MNELEHTNRILQQGKALVRAIEALETIEPTGPIEQVMVWLLLRAYRRRLRAMVGAAPQWLAEEIRGASQEISDRRPVQWISNN